MARATWPGQGRAIFGGRVFKSQASGEQSLPLLMHTSKTITMPAKMTTETVSPVAQWVRTIR